MAVQKVPDPVDLHIGARLKFRRMAAGMSQEALGDALGLTFQQIQKYEKGQNRIGASRLFRIARILNAPLGFFFEGIEPDDGPARDAAAAPLAFLGTPEGIELNLAFSRIPDATTRRKIVDLVRTLGADAASDRPAD
jgi:transcriptional regulator with XRE-family HTH domain